MAILVYSEDEKRKILTSLQLHEKDTGSTAVIVARLTFGINKLAKHLEKNKKDIPSQRQQVERVATRRCQLKYLKNNDFARYELVLTTLNLRK
jgi:small subunit ribosomal protein S15